eukprot:5967206-Pyramimonas_sp.AAC.1
MESSAEFGPKISSAGFMGGPKLVRMSSLDQRVGGIRRTRVAQPAELTSTCVEEAQLAKSHKTAVAAVDNDAAVAQVSKRLGRNLQLLSTPPRRRLREGTRALEALVALPEF